MRSPSWFDHPLSWNFSYCHLLQHWPTYSQYMISSRKADCSRQPHPHLCTLCPVLTRHTCRNVTHLMVQLVLPAAFARLSHAAVSSSLWLSVELCTLCSARARELSSGGPQHGPWLRPATSSSLTKEFSYVLRFHVVSCYTSWIYSRYSVYA